MSEFINFISSVGFPIACCVYIIYTNSKKLEKLEETINNNTNVMIRLCEKLGVEEEVEEL